MLQPSQAREVKLPSWSTHLKLWSLRSAELTRSLVIGNHSSHMSWLIRNRTDMRGSDMMLWLREMRSYPSKSRRIGCVTWSNSRNLSKITIWTTLGRSSWTVLRLPRMTQPILLKCQTSITVRCLTWWNEWPSIIERASKPFHRMSLSKCLRAMQSSYRSWRGRISMPWRPALMTLKEWKEDLETILRRLTTTKS